MGGWVGCRGVGCSFGELVKNETFVFALLDNENKKELFFFWFENPKRKWRPSGMAARHDEVPLLLFFYRVFNGFLPSFPRVLYRVDF